MSQLEELQGCRFCSCDNSGSSASADDWENGECPQCQHHHNDHRGRHERGFRCKTTNLMITGLNNSKSVQMKSNFRAYIAAAYYPGDGTVTMQLPDGSDRVVKQPNRRFACMLSGELGDNDQVRVLNLMPLKSTDVQIEAANITRIELCSTENCLLVADQIKRAYEHLDISFVPVSKQRPGEYVMKIWKPVGWPACDEHRGDVRGIPLWDNTCGQVSSKLIGEFEGHRLFIGSGSILQNAMAYQAFHAKYNAMERGWTRLDSSIATDETMARITRLMQIKPVGTK